MTDDTMTRAGETTGAVPSSGPAPITENLLARYREEDTAVGAGAASLADTGPTGSAG
jgi:hypothetical protein